MAIRIVVPAAIAALRARNASKFFDAGLSASGKPPDFGGFPVLERSKIFRIFVPGKLVTLLDMTVSLC